MFKQFKLNCKNLDLNEDNEILSGQISFEFLHLKDDPAKANRIKISNGILTVEVLPSKGFSIGQMLFNGRPLLWEPPIDLCDTENIDLYSDEIAINGVPSPGFTFLKTLYGGIEFYGLRNWGMPVRDEKTGFLHPIHGETSNIPVDLCTVEVSDRGLTLSASFIYRDFSGDPEGVWYLQGRELFEVTRSIVLEKDKQQLQITDRIKNISNEPLNPDWGYHITFRPEDGSRLVVPSASVENRSGGPVPEDHEKWTPAVNDKVREETGIIHKGLKTVSTGMGNMTCALVVHPDDTGIKVSFPPTPYFQTWFCKGGANSTEFTKVSDGTPLFRRNWDGIGIEIGSSALDHNGNTDPAVSGQKILSPGSAVEIPISIELKRGKELEQLAEEIERN